MTATLTELGLDVDLDAHIPCIYDTCDAPATWAWRLPCPCPITTLCTPHHNNDIHVLNTVIARRWNVECKTCNTFFQPELITWWRL